MKVPLEITYRDVAPSEPIEALVRKKVEKLEQVCNYLSSCRVALEAESQRRQEGNQYRVRIDMTVPPSKELVVSNSPGDNDRLTDLPTAIRLAFEAARKQLVTLVGKQNREVKQHPEQEVEGVVIRVLADKGYGFLRDQSGREVYFHENSLLGSELEELEPGVGVNFFEHEGEGEFGPQASSVRVVDSRSRPVSSP